MNGNETHLFAVGAEMVDSLLSSLGYRTHSDDYALSFRITVVVEETVFTTGDTGDFLHVFLYDFRNTVIVFVASLTVLEENVAVFSHAACYRIVGVEGTCAEFSECFLIDERSEVVLIHLFDLLDFVRCTESVEEVDERNTALDSGEVCHTCEVHHFLH